MQLRIEYEQTHEGGQVCEGQEDDAWPNFEPTYITTYFKGIVRDLPEGGRLFRYNYETVDVHFEVNAGDELYVAVVTYSDGDTFQTTHGYIYIVGAYQTYEEAQDAIDGAKQVTDYSVPWNGYFSGRGGDDVHCLRVE